MSQPTPQEAMIYLMVMMSAADRDMTDAELGRIGSIIHNLPVFAGFDPDRTIEVARQCQERLQQEDGMEGVLRTSREAIPERLRETAYALAVEVAAADLQVEPEEMRMLQLMRNRLGIERLVAVAIERGARARHRTAL